jgi:hypothetical protein
LDTEIERGVKRLRTYYDTNVVSYSVRARRKEDYKQKLETIEHFIEEGVIIPITSVITEDETEKLKKTDVKNYLEVFVIVKSSIAVFPIKLDRDCFGNDYTYGLYGEYVEGEARPKHLLDREDALHYVNILDKNNKIELAISGDKELVNKLKSKHNELPILYFHDTDFSNTLMKIVKEFG